MATTRAAMYGGDPAPRTVTTAPGIRAAAARSAVPRTIQLSSLRVTTVPSASTKPTPGHCRAIRPVTRMAARGSNSTAIDRALTEPSELRVPSTCTMPRRRIAAPGGTGRGKTGQQQDAEGDRRTFGHREHPHLHPGAHDHPAGRRRSRQRRPPAATEGGAAAAVKAEREQPAAHTQDHAGHRVRLAARRLTGEDAARGHGARQQDREQEHPAASRTHQRRKNCAASARRTLRGCAPTTVRRSPLSSQVSTRKYPNSITRTETPMEVAISPAGAHS